MESLGYSNKLPLNFLLKKSASLNFFINITIRTSENKPKTSNCFTELFAYILNKFFIPLLIFLYIIINHGRRRKTVSAALPVLNEIK